MKLHPSAVLVSMLLAGSTALAAGPSSSLLPVRPGDQVPTHLQGTSPLMASPASLDRRATSFSWAIDAKMPLDAGPTPFDQRSREYWTDASAEQLRQGLPLSTSADGALIRLSPHAGNDSVLDPSTLSIRANGRIYAGAQAIRSAADEDALRAAGMEVPRGSVVFKVNSAVGHGAIELLAPTATGTYLVHVFEPASPIVLTLKADRDTTLAGESIVFRASVVGGATLDRLGGLLSAPDGHSQDVDFTRQADGSYEARVRPDAVHAGGFGLWEIHAFGQAGNERIQVARDARNAFSVAVPLARLDGSIERLALSGKDAGLSLRVGIETAMASRFQLAGVLFGTRADGTLAPAAVGHSAAWLEPGSATIDLRFDADVLRQSGVGAPFELRDLRLINQADMSLIERRERAASLR